MSQMLAVLALLFLPGCVDKKLQEDLDLINSNLVSENENLSRLLQSDSRQRISWNDAKSQLLQKNVQIIRSQDRIDQLNKAKQERWKTWLPSVTFFASIDKGLTELGDISFSDLNASAIAPLRIPNPFSERAVAFELALRLKQAELSHDLVVRQQIISLYRLFLRTESLENNSGEDTGSGESLSSELQALRVRKGRENELKAVQANLSTILNSPGLTALPAPGTRPKLDYSRRIDILKPGKNYGRTAITFSTYLVQAAILNEKGIKLQRWPGFSLNASSPPLYDSRRDDSFGATDFEDALLFGSTSKTYEFTGQEAEAVETAEENVELVKQQALLNLDRDTRAWLRVKSNYKGLQAQREALQFRLKSVGKNTDSAIGATAKLDAVRSSQSALRDLELQIKDLETQIWLWDDEKWK
ncbi:hypothetical protein [Luteolibacter sp. AS25]|uniref:hypothetical protein n=1 Tax=Luteolibacter sp. AS25 TaxID=3135776 RepID=UPI00398B9AA5